MPNKTYVFKAKFQMTTEEKLKAFAPLPTLPTSFELMSDKQFKKLPIKSAPQFSIIKRLSDALPGIYVCQGSRTTFGKFQFRATCWHKACKLEFHVECSIKDLY